MTNPSPVARHEAAHAVVAECIGLTVEEVTIKPSFRIDPLTGERVDVAGRTLVRYCPDTAGRELAGIALAAARIEVERGFEWKGPGRMVDYDSDEEKLRTLAAESGIRDDEFAAWRQSLDDRARRILYRPDVTEAVRAIALELDKLQTIPPEMVGDTWQLYAELDHGTECPQ